MNHAVDTDRRQQPRPMPPQPKLRVGLCLLTDRLAKKLFCCWQSTSVFILLQVVALVTAIWSVTVRMPEDDTALALTASIGHLQQQLDTLRVGWSEDEMQQLQLSLQQTQASVFTDAASLAVWLQHKAEEAQREALVLHYKIRPAQATHLSDTLVLPVQLTLKLAPGLTDNAYNRVLLFVHGLMGGNHRIEVQDAIATGEGRGLTELSLLLRVWVYDRQNLVSVKAEHAADAEADDASYFD